MKLTATQVEQALTQFEARVVPVGHPVDAELIELFGDHTFFLDNSGVSILETPTAPEQGVEPGDLGEVISLADWTDTTYTQLRPHDPEPTGVVVALGSRH